MALTILLCATTIPSMTDDTFGAKDDTVPIPFRVTGMSDTELTALAALVHTSALGARSFDEDRLARGLAPGYGDTWIDGQRELRAELVRRGILGDPE